MKLKIIPIGDKIVEKKDCVISKEVRQYKGRKIEVGLSKKDHFLAVFVDDMWLTGTPVEELWQPALDGNEQARDMIAELTIQTIRTAEKIIDHAVEYEDEREKKTGGYIQ
jgi:hypothetical protein